MRVLSYPGRDALNVHVADAIASALRTALAQHAAATLAVPGGSTPGPIFDILCGAPLDWARVKVLPTDERWVPEDHPRSNAGLIRARLLTGRAAAATLVPLTASGAARGGPLGDPRDVLPGLGAALAAHLPLSVVLLGMGADMHTASLFPGAPGLAEALAPDAPPLCLLSPEGQPEQRVSLSAAVLNGALDKHLVFIGAQKKAAFEAAQGLPPEAAPVGAVLGAITAHWTETE